MPTVQIPPANTVEELRQSLSFVLNRIANQRVSDQVDANQQRIVRVATPTTLTDAVNVQYLRQMLDDLRKESRKFTNTYVTNAIEALLIGINVGTHADRPPVRDAGESYWESDRTLLYVAADLGSGLEWVYLAGKMHVTLSPNTKPTDLNASGDVGVQIYATDYAHTWTWTGSTWDWGADESGEVTWRVGVPTHGAWALCNGGSTNISTQIATVVPFTTPNLINKYLKGGNVYTGVPSPAVAPTVAIDTNTGHSHVVNISHSHSTTGGGISYATGTNVASVISSVGPLSSSVSSDTQGAHTHIATVGTNGEPPNCVLLPYLRL